MLDYFKLIWKVVQKIYCIGMTRRFFAPVNHQICCGFPELKPRNITRIINLLTVTASLGMALACSSVRYYARVSPPWLSVWMKGYC